jgi:hypothetical protein
MQPIGFTTAILGIRALINYMKNLAPISLFSLQAKSGLLFNQLFPPLQIYLQGGNPSSICQPSFRIARTSP